jgi:uncharacterized membrane protein YjfL (UPF0719 family)
LIKIIKKNNKRKALAVALVLLGQSTTILEEIVDTVSLKYWLSFVSKMKRKEPSVRRGFIAVRT